MSSDNTTSPKIGVGTATTPLSLKLNAFKGGGGHLVMDTLIRGAHTYIQAAVASLAWLHPSTPEGMSSSLRDEEWP